MATGSQWRLIRYIALNLRYNARTRSRALLITAALVFGLWFVFFYPFAEDGPRDYETLVIPDSVDPRTKNERDIEYCQQHPMFVDIARTAECKKPALSIVYLTKRPGGYDMLFRSLAKQTVKDYELVCIDELAPWRSTKAKAYAKELGIPLVDIVPSKPKDEKLASAKYGIGKALNTGLMLTSGSFIAIAMDFIWLPPNFVERTLEFYKTHPKSFLAYPQLLFSNKDNNAIVDNDHMSDSSSLTLFKEEMQAAPSSLGEKGWTVSAKKPEDVINRKPGFEKEQGQDLFWDLSLASAPWAVIEALNGFDEGMDHGDDCHELNIRLRGEEFLGYDLWIDGQTVAELADHKTFNQARLWQRNAQDTNWERMMKILKDIREKTSALAASNSFNLAQWREHECPAKIYGRPPACQADVQASDAAAAAARHR